MRNKRNKQTASAVLMIRPINFGWNPETAKTNFFQARTSKGISVQKKALDEFNNFVALLKKNDIDVIVFDENKKHSSPDAIFPNNWFTTHHDGKVVIYSMLSPLRRKEIRTDIFRKLKDKLGYKISNDYSFDPAFGLPLEGTGSIVFDHENKFMYANKSSRTDMMLLFVIAFLLNYSFRVFNASDKNGNEIYHTNVMLAIATDFVVICKEAIDDAKRRKEIVSGLENTGRKIIPISFEQMEKFAANILQVRNKKNELITIMSKTAFNSFTKRQKSIMEKTSKILSVPVPTIEKVGGGSVRCMMAEIFLPKKKV